MPKSKRTLHGSVTKQALLAGAAIVGTAALANWVAAAVAERKHPPRGRFVTVRGIRLHYLDEGDGPPIVLLHGNGAVAEDWQISGIVSRLSRQHRVIAFDRPGSGYTDRPRDKVWSPQEQAGLLGEALEALGVAAPVVVGHSWGTLTAVALALGGRIAPSGLVLLSGYYYGEPRPRSLLSAISAMPVVGDLWCHTVGPLLTRLTMPAGFRMAFAPEPVASRFEARFPAGLTARPSQVRAVAAETALLDPAAATLQHRYGEIGIPVVIAAGEGDQIVDTERQSRRLHAELAGSRFTLIAGAGHMVHYSDPNRISDLIRTAAGKAGKREADGRSHQNDLLDEAIEETFPASDPISPAIR